MAGERSWKERGMNLMDALDGEVLKGVESMCLTKLLNRKGSKT